jgi:signal transduction histidine kinase
MADAARPSLPVTALRCLLVAAAYLATGKAGLLLAFAGSNVAPVFPASGVAVAAVLLGGWRMLPGVWLGALLLNLTGMPAALAPWVATGNTAETAAVVALLHLFAWAGPAERLRDVLALAGAAMIGCLVAAVNGITALCTAGLIPWAAFVDAWWTWWLGDVMGILVAAPAILAWARPRPRVPQAGRAGEWTILVCVSLSVSLLVFTPAGPWQGGSLPLAYAIFPAVLYAAVRFGARGTTLVSLLVSIVAVCGSVAGFGPFADFPTVNERLLALQALLASAVLSGLALAAALHERQRAQDELIRVSLALDRAGDLVLFADAGGTVVYANRSARTLLAAVGPVGRPLADLLGGGSCGCDDTPPPGAVRELDVPLPDGSLLPLEVSCTATPGDPPGTIAIARDLRERRRLQEQLARRSAMEGMGRMAGGVAHDFNNLLAVILGFAETARGRLDANHPASAALDHVREAGRSASVLTRQLLAFSRRQVLQPRVLDLSAAVAGARTVVEDLAGPRIRLVVEAADPAWVRADPAQIHQVLLNLVTNARDAQPDGGTIRIRVATLELDAPAVRRLRGGDPVGAARARTGRWVRLTVEDCGHGMDEAVRLRVFEPFFTTRGGGRGTGLGLSTVHGIVEQSDGFIAIDSTPGTGTAMQVHLPATDPAQVRGEDDSRLVRAIGRLRVAVCDDQPVIAALVADMLAGTATEVRTFTGVADLRRGLDGGGAFDLLITDVAMPDGGGSAAVAAARAALPGIAVLYISGNPMDHGLDLEGAGFLAKPFDRAALLAAALDAVAMPRPRPGGPPG